jgi:hypothetical protein
VFTDAALASISSLARILKPVILCSLCIRHTEWIRHHLLSRMTKNSKGLSPKRYVWTQLNISHAVH